MKMNIYLQVAQHAKRTSRLICIYNTRKLTTMLTFSFKIWRTLLVSFYICLTFWVLPMTKLNILLLLLILLTRSKKTLILYFFSFKTNKCLSFRSHQPILTNLWLLKNIYFHFCICKFTKVIGNKSLTWCVILTVNNSTCNISLQAIFNVGKHWFLWVWTLLKKSCVKIQLKNMGYLTLFFC